MWEDSAWVCCPEGFCRKGNVDIVCDRYGIRRFSTLREMVEELKALPPMYNK